MSRAPFFSFVVAAVMLSYSAPVRAQPARAQTEAPPGRVELGFGVLWLGLSSLGSIDATETTGAGGKARIFSTSTDVASATGIEGRLAVRLSRRFEAEATAAYLRPELRATISNDIEVSGTVIATETIRQFTIGGAVLWYVPSRTSTRRLWPFVIGGAGYLRQLHESATLAVTGQTCQIGGGVKYLFGSRRPSRPLSGLGVRADARLVGRRKGVAFDDRLRFSPALGGSILARF